MHTAEVPRRIKVRMLINDCLLGGAQIVAADVARLLNREHFDTALWYLYEPRAAQEGKPTLRERLNNNAFSLVNLHIRTIPQGVREVRKRLQEEQVDVLHCHLPDSVVCGGIAALSLGIPFIIHEHQTHAFHSWKIRLAYRLLRPFAAVTICFTEAVEQELFGAVRVLKTPPKRIEHRSYTIYNGIDTDRAFSILTQVNRGVVRASLGFSGDDILIISIARFEEWKGHRLLLEAFRSVAERISNAKLCIVGDGPLREELRTRARALRLEGCVSLPGASSDVYELLASSDIFSLVFTHPAGVAGDAIGIAGFEAMAMGLPVIIGAYRGAAFYIRDGKNGLVVAPNDPQALADALCMLARDTNMRTRLGAAARDFIVQNLTWDAIVPIYEALYQLITRV